MLASFVELDRVLRGELTRLDDLKSGSVPLRLGGMAPVLVLLAMINGACLGIYARVTRPGRVAVGDTLRFD